MTSHWTPAERLQEVYRRVITDFYTGTTETWGDGERAIVVAPEGPRAINGAGSSSPRSTESEGLRAWLVVEGITTMG